MLGLLDEGEELYYQPGHGGYTPEVRVYTSSDRRQFRHTSFTPTFHRGYKTTATDAWIILSATEDALAAAANQYEAKAEVIASTTPPDMTAEEYNEVMDALMARVAGAPDYAVTKLLTITDSIKNKFGRHAPQR